MFWRTSCAEQHLSAAVTTQPTAPCGRVVVMDGGHIVMDGEPQEVFTRAEDMRRMRLDVPPMVALGDLLRARGMKISREAMDIDSMAREVLKCL